PPGAKAKQRCGSGPASRSSADASWKPASGKKTCSAVRVPTSGRRWTGCTLRFTPTLQANDRPGEFPRSVKTFLHDARQLVIGEQLLGGSPPAVPFHFSAAGGGEPLPFSGVLEQPAGFLLQIGGVAGFEHEAGDAVVDHVGDAACPGADHGHTGGH